jgi:Zn-finger nucleic acid-binding protein
MTRVDDAGIRYASCAQCFGTWIRTISVKRFINLDARQNSANAPVEDPNQATLADLASVVATADTKTVLRCPECEKPMQKTRYHSMIPVIIDRCRACDSLWLDAGELALLRRLFYEMATSDDPKIVQLREKIASVASQWTGRTTATQELHDAIEDASDYGDVLDTFIRILGR